MSCWIRPVCESRILRPHSISLLFPEDQTTQGCPDPLGFCVKLSAKQQGQRGHLGKAGLWRSRGPRWRPGGNGWPCTSSTWPHRGLHSSQTPYWDCPHRQGSSGTFVTFRWLCSSSVSLINFQDDLAVSTRIFPTKMFPGPCSCLWACSNHHPHKGGWALGPRTRTFSSAN